MKRWILILLISLTLFGCSGRFIYNNIDWLVIDYLEDYVELNDGQEAVLSEKISLLSEWHRHEEIPNYIAHLDELMKVDPNTFTHEDLKNQQAKFQQHSQRLVSKITPQTYDLVSQLSDDQVEELMNNIRVRHARYKKKYNNLDEKEIREKYSERIEESFEDWLGSLNKEQKQLIANWTNELYVTSYDWIEHQTKMRIEMKTLLGQRSMSDVFESHLSQLVNEPASFYSPDLERKIAHNKSVGDRYTVDLINSMTKKQTRYFREELEDWKEIAMDLQ